MRSAFSKDARTFVKVGFVFMASFDVFTLVQKTSTISESVHYCVENA